MKITFMTSMNDAALLKYWYIIAHYIEHFVSLLLRYQLFHQRIRNIYV